MYCSTSAQVKCSAVQKSQCTVETLSGSNVQPMQDAGYICTNKVFIGISTNRNFHPHIKVFTAVGFERVAYCLCLQAYMCKRELAAAPTKAPGKNLVPSTRKLLRTHLVLSTCDVQCTWYLQACVCKCRCQLVPNTHKRVLVRKHLVPGT